MMAHAGGAGLRFLDADWKLIREHRNVHDKLYNSRAGLSAYYHYRPRDIAGLCRGPGGAARAALPNGNAPLDRVRGQVSQREWNQTFTIAFTLAAACGIVFLGSEQRTLGG